MMNRFPIFGDEVQIHPSVTFVPYGDKTTVIDNRVKIDSGAVIYGGVEIGADSLIGHNTVIRFNTRIGIHTRIANLCMLEADVKIGDHTLIHSNNHIGQKTVIEDYVFMAPLCVTTNDPEMFYYRKGYTQTGEHHELLQGVLIKNGARIAVGVIIFPGVTIGEHAVLGAGAVVTKDIPDYAVAFGTPAQIKRYIDPKTDIIIECTRNHSRGARAESN